MGIKWKTWKQTENHRKSKKSPQPTGNWLRGNWKHSENSRIYSVFSQKNCPLSCQIPESGRESGHQVGKTALKWLDNTVKPCPKIGWRNRHFSTIQQRNKPVTSFFVTGFWWELVDSNHRSIKQQIYSLSPLATRESSHIHLCLCLNSAWLL